ncbi:MAG: hypothetical protein GC145_16245 [Caulobacter sp.]|nr:hypothetical protein [Caulobacter sp.]
MKRALFLSFALMAAPLPGQAATQTVSMEAVFDNTIVSTYPSGRSTRLWLNRDGSYSARRTNGKATAGRWSRKGDRVCLRQTRPIAIPLTFCSKIVSGGVGTRWESRSPKGEPLKNRLVAGRN